MRRLVATAVAKAAAAALVLALAAAVAITAQAKPVNCGPASARTLAASRLARVYAVGREVRGCAKAHAGSHRLGRLAPCPAGAQCVGLFRVAGTDVAFARTLSGVDTSESQLVVRSLTTGRTLFLATATRRSTGPESVDSVDAIVLRSDGALAWIGAEHSLIARRSETEVNRHDSRGAALLDSGPQIRIRSLRLHGSTLSWRHGGSVRLTSLR